MSVIPKSSWPWVKTLLQTVYDQPDADAVRAHFDRVLEALEHKLPKSFNHLEGAREEILAFTVFPKEIWKQTDPYTTSKDLTRVYVNWWAPTSLGAVSAPKRSLGRFHWL